MTGAAAPSFIISLLAGVLSFLSPCILPLVPSYLSFVGGLELKAGGKARLSPTLLLRMLGFILGFSCVFVLLGILISASSVFIPRRTITLISGIVITVFGLHITFDLFKILNREKRILPDSRPQSFFAAFLVGLAFAGGWTPCVGPVLASILSLAASGEGLNSAIWLLGFYSIGLALPFVLTTLLFPTFMKVFPTLKKNIRVFRIACGILLTITGLLMLSNRIVILNQVLARLSDTFRAWSQLPRTQIVIAVCFACIAVLIVLRGLQKKRMSLLRAFVAACFLALAILEGLGLLNTARGISSWLLYSGI